MRLLSWHCKYLRYKDTEASSRPAGIDAVAREPSSATFTGYHLAVFVCVEEGDGESQLVTAVATIRELASTMGRDHIVIVPFAHLSGKLAHPELATSLLEHLKDRLADAGLRVSSTTFGTHKEFEMCYESMGHPASVTFRDIR